MRVLVVDDDARLAGNVRRALQEAGIAVDAVADGEAGLASADATAYDVVVLDVMLPKLDGVELCRRLRSRKIGVPVLMLTARDTVDDRVAGLESGADDYLVKPFSLRELIARVRALARRHLDDRASVLTAGPLSLDTAALELSVGGRAVPLTAKEFAVLECLVRNRGRVLSQDQIIESAWNGDFTGGYNLVEVYVARLRRKLAETPARDALTTVRGAGYKLRA